MLSKRRSRSPEIDFDFDWEDKSRSKKSRKNPKLGDGFFNIEEYLKQPELNGKYRNWDIMQILKTAPVEQIDISDLKHNLKVSEWDDSDGNMFSAQQFIADPESPKFRHHQKRVKHADLQYPVYLWKDGDTNQFFLIDGMHRYVKVLMDQAADQKISAKILTDEHLRMLQSPLRYLHFATQEDFELDRYLSTVVRKRRVPLPKTKSI